MSGRVGELEGRRGDQRRFSEGGERADEHSSGSSLSSTTRRSCGGEGTAVHHSNNTQARPLYNTHHPNKNILADSASIPATVATSKSHTDTVYDIIDGYTDSSEHEEEEDEEEEVDDDPWRHRLHHHTRSWYDQRMAGVEEMLHPALRTPAAIPAADDGEGHQEDKTAQPPLELSRERLGKWDLENDHLENNEHLEEVEDSFGNTTKWTDVSICSPPPAIEQVPTWDVVKRCYNNSHSSDQDLLPPAPPLYRQTQLTSSSSVYSTEGSGVPHPPALSEAASESSGARTVTPAAKCWWAWRAKTRTRTRGVVMVEGGAVLCSSWSDSSSDSVAPEKTVGVVGNGSASSLEKIAERDDGSGASRRGGTEKTTALPRTSSSLTARAWSGREARTELERGSPLEGDGGQHGSVEGFRVPREGKHRRGPSFPLVGSAGGDCRRVSATPPRVHLVSRGVPPATGVGLDSGTDANVGMREGGEGKKVEKEEKQEKNKKHEKGENQEAKNGDEDEDEDERVRKAIVRRRVLAIETAERRRSRAEGVVKGDG